MGAVPGARSLDCRVDSDIPTGFAQGCDILHPRGLVEINCQQPTRLVRQQWVQADHVAAPKVIEDNLIAKRQKRLVRAFSALDSRFLADSANPLVGARGRIAALPGPGVRPQPGEHIEAAPKQAAKEG